MTENGDPCKNEIAERVNGILKEKYELSETFSDYRSALEATKVAVYKYNNKRPHRSIDFMFPVDADRQSGPLKKHWKKQEFNVTEKAETEHNLVTKVSDKI